MKESNKILLYGLLASILLILLCLYAHQDEFMNEKKDVVLESEKRDEPIKQKNNNIIVSVKKDIEKNDTSKKVEVKEPMKVKVPVNKATIEVLAEENLTDENLSKTSDGNSSMVDDNTSTTIINRTMFKNKEDIKLKEHPKVESVEKIEEVDNHLPIEDNKPLIDNDSPKKKKKELKTAPKTSKKVTSKSITSIQKSISEITSRNISFYKNKSEITFKSKKTLNKVIKILKTVPNVKIVVKGYTDASGKEKTNLWISEERAKSVRKYLGKHGIPLKNIVAKGLGESELLYGDKPYSELNRRVEIEIKRK